MTENKTNPETEKSSLEEKQLEFEKYKTKLELYKWLIGSVALVLVTTVIDFGFRDRAAGLQEIQQYDKYVTELIVLNKEPAQKRMLAQFFANVTPSEKLKKGWCNYFKQIDKEYQIYIAPVLKNDSIAKEKYNLIIGNLDTSNTKQKQQLEILERQIETNNLIINPDIILPSKISTNDYDAALEWESEGFKFLLAKDIENAIEAFRNSENAYNRFHQVHEIAKYLNENKSKLTEPNSEFWKIAFRQIANEYSWRMPLEMKNKLIANSN